MVSKSKAKKKTNESIKRKLLNSLKENKDVEEQELNETVNLSTTLKMQYP